MLGFEVQLKIDQKVAVSNAFFDGHNYCCC